MFKQETVWDPFVMTKGTVVRLTGYSYISDFNFKGLDYKVKAINNGALVVQSKNGRKYSIETFEIDDDPDIDLTIEIVSQVPYVMPF